MFQRLWCWMGMHKWVQIGDVSYIHSDALCSVSKHYCPVCDKHWVKVGLEYLTMQQWNRLNSVIELKDKR